MKKFVWFLLAFITAMVITWPFVITFQVMDACGFRALMNECVITTKGKP